MHKGILVYISGPMTAKNGHTIEENTAQGLQYFLMLTKLGIPSFCPHLNAGFPECFMISWDIWLDYDLAVIDRCTHMLMLPRWKESDGAIKEKDYAESIELPILYSITELAELLDVQE